MQCQPSAGILLREARGRQGLSQRRLAIRAGTSQDAISRIERGVESPTIERFTRLMLMLGEQVELRSEVLAGPVGSASLTPRERLREAASWNLVATTLELAGAEARRAGHPATRILG